MFQTLKNIVYASLKYANTAFGIGHSIPNSCCCCCWIIIAAIIVCIQLFKNALACQFWSVVKTNIFLPDCLGLIFVRWEKTFYKRLPFPKKRSDDFTGLCDSSLKGILNILVESEIERQRVNWFTWKETHLNGNLHHWKKQEIPLWSRKIFIPQAVVLLPNAISPKKQTPLKGTMFRGLDENKGLTSLFSILSCCYNKML